MSPSVFIKSFFLIYNFGLPSPVTYLIFYLLNICYKLIFVVCYMTLISGNYKCMANTFFVSNCTEGAGGNVEYLRTLVAKELIDHN